MSSERSTKDLTVYGMHRDTANQTTIMYGKSQRSAKVKASLGGCSLDAQNAFLADLRRLYHTLVTYCSVTERLLLLFDNNAIQAVLHKDKSNHRALHYHTLLAFLILAEDYLLLDIFCCVSPTIVYEANCRREITSDAEATTAFQDISGTMIEIGLAVTYLGFRGFEQLVGAIKQIRQDERSVGAALDAIKNRSFAVPDTRLKYFSPWDVKYLLMQLIVKRLFDENQHALPFRDFCKQEVERGYFNILKRKRGKLEGLADIELLTSCELNTQSVVQSPEICMALTFDKTLSDLLLSRMNVAERPLQHLSGDDPLVTASAVAYSWGLGDKSLEKVNRRQGEYHKAFLKFADEPLSDFYS